jgi:hypothetical protein
MLKHDIKQLCPKYKKPIGDADGILYDSALFAIPDAVGPQFLKVEFALCLSHNIIH